MNEVLLVTSPKMKMAAAAHTTDAYVLVTHQDVHTSMLSCDLSM
jgi:hypothetical protein